LIPYPHAAADHQTVNAQTLVDAGAAVMIADRDVKMKLKDVLNSIMNDEKKLKNMNEASHAIGKPNAGREIAQRILELVK
jgi:UDP-N-acetylglucosamine--N-acetylmuramyl-(pentapeptide) pyrophosphoryl-undecaprenol N-acetylglucosamine transferase